MKTTFFNFYYNENTKMPDKIPTNKFKMHKPSEIVGFPIRYFRLRRQRNKKTSAPSRKSAKIVLRGTNISTKAKAKISNQLRTFLYHAIWPKYARLYEKKLCLPRLVNLLAVKTTHKTNKNIPIYFQFIHSPACLRTNYF